MKRLKDWSFTLLRSLLLYKHKSGEKREKIRLMFGLSPIEFTERISEKLIERVNSENISDFLAEYFLQNKMKTELIEMYVNKCIEDADRVDIFYKIVSNHLVFNCFSFGTKKRYFPPLLQALG